MASISDIIDSYPQLRTNYYEAKSQIYTLEKEVQNLKAQIALLSSPTQLVPSERSYSEPIVEEESLSLPEESYGELVVYDSLLQAGHNKNVEALNKEVARLNELVEEQRSQLLQNEDMISHLIVENNQLRNELHEVQKRCETFDKECEKMQVTSDKLNILGEEWAELNRIHNETKADALRLVEFLTQQFRLPNALTVDDLITQLDQLIQENNETLLNYESELSSMRARIEHLELSTEEKERRVRDTIETLDSRISGEIDNINVELELYNDTNDKYNSNPLELHEFVYLEEYSMDESNIRPEFIPFLGFVSSLVNNVNDFELDENNKNKSNLYHTYMILLYKLLGIYSKKYIRNYLELVYKECVRVSQNNEQSVKLPRLVLPQTFQTNSLYFLMNRYNSKAYEPDRVFDFGDFLFNFVKPEFREDTTKALNLFQAGIGKRYNSILIYTPETMNKLRELRDNLSTLLSSHK